MVLQQYQGQQNTRPHQVGPPVNKKGKGGPTPMPTGSRLARVLWQTLQAALSQGWTDQQVAQRLVTKINTCKSSYCWKNNSKQPSLEYEKDSGGTAVWSHCELNGRTILGVKVLIFESLIFGGWAPKITFFEWSAPSDILSDVYSDILFGILSEMNCGILSDVPSDTSADTWAGILTDIEFDILSVVVSGILSDIYIHIYTYMYILYTCVFNLQFTYILAFFLSSISTSYLTFFLACESNVWVSCIFSLSKQVINHPVKTSIPRAWKGGAHIGRTPLNSLMDSRVIQHGSVTKSQQLATSKSNHRDLRISEASATLCPFSQIDLMMANPQQHLLNNPCFQLRLRLLRAKFVLDWG